MLTQRAVVPYLMRRGLVSAVSFVDGDLEVVDASRRNLNFQVISERGPSYMLKQGVGPDGTRTIAHEAAVYEQLQSRAGDYGLDRYLARFYGYDPKEQILILEFFRDAENLREYHDRRGRFSTALSSSLGKALGTLHQLRWKERKSEDYVQGFVSRPWILSLHRPDVETFQGLSSANIQVIKIVQKYAEFCDFLDGLRRDWTTEALIHSDIRWDNFLIVARQSTSQTASLRIIDWELARGGDPCWDVGSVFNDYLSYWLNSIPITGEAPPERFAELARYPLGKMQPAIRSFWESYVRRMKLDAATCDQWLLRAVKYGAVRLLQTAIEHTQMSLTLTGSVVCFLQVSLNILQRPREATVQLLGIPLRAGSTL